MRLRVDVIILLIIMRTAYGISPETKTALLELYSALNGVSWGNWTTVNDSDPCTWVGITCRPNLNELFQIQLSNMSLSGTLPQSIGNLANLDTLSLHHNQISGTIPETIGNLTELVQLNLQRNQLTGTIPETINKLTKLKLIFLGWNTNLQCSPSYQILNQSLDSCDLSNLQCGCDNTTLHSCEFGICKTPPPTNPPTIPPPTPPPTQPPTLSPTTNPTTYPPTSAPTSPLNMTIISAEEFKNSAENNIYSISSPLIIIGNISFDSSSVLIIQGFSFVNISGCIDLDGKLILNVSGIDQKDSVLLNPINANCVTMGFDKVDIVGTSSCISSSESVEETSSYYVLISFQSDCGSSFPVYGIVLLAVLPTLAIIALIVGVSVYQRRTRKKLPNSSIFFGTKK